MDDLISRQDVLDAIDKYILGKPEGDNVEVRELLKLITKVYRMPSAQPEIITCKDCKYSDENWRRVSVRWLPCMDVRTGSNWYCGSAERSEQDG